MAWSPTKRPTDTRKKRTWTRQKGEGLHPSNAQSKEEMKGREHEPKSPYVFHAAKVKHPLEHTAKSNKHSNSKKGVKARKVTDSDRSGAYTQSPSTAYLYPANTWELGHGSRVSKGGWWWGEKRSLFWGFRSNFLGKKCPTRMASHPKEVSISWNHLMHAIDIGKGEV